MRKLLALTAGAVALLAIAATDQSAWSQAARTIRVIISVPPGGSIDLLFRILADQISTTKGQTILVESRPGAGGIIAAEAVARAAPDGATLLSNNNGMIISSILRKVNYHPRESFEPICYLVSTPQIIVVNSASPYRTLAELAPPRVPSRPNCRSQASGPDHPAHRHRTAQAACRGQSDLCAVSGRGYDLERAARRACDLRGAELVGGRRAGDRRQGPRARDHGVAADRAEPDLPTVVGIRLQGFRDRRVVRAGGAREDAERDGGAAHRLVPRCAACAAGQGKLTAQALYPNPKCGADFDAHLQRQSDLYTRLIRELNIKTE